MITEKLPADRFDKIVALQNWYENKPSWFVAGDALDEHYLDERTDLIQVENLGEGWLIDYLEVVDDITLLVGLSDGDLNEVEVKFIRLP